MSPLDPGFFFRHYPLTTGDLEKTPGRTLSRGADFADLYFEYTVQERLQMEEELVKNWERSVSQGVGVRALCGAKTGYAYSDLSTPEKLLQAAKTGCWWGSCRTG